jgi:glucose/arabinose dehydrogenase
MVESVKASRWWRASALAAVITACTSGAVAPSATAPQVGTATPAATSPRPSGRPEPSPNAPLPGARLERGFGGLSFQRMTGAHQLPDGRWLILEQPGRILAWSDGQSQASVFLDIRDRVNSSGNEEGLLGLALAPDFERTGVFFLDYTRDNPRRTVISSFTSAGAADPRSEAVILEVGQPFTNHNGGQIAFGPDGYLYIGMGDGGSGGDPQGHGQNRATLLGDVLRIDVRDRTRYTVPADNPFVGRDGRPEIWAYGVRNPWRFSFDIESGALWLGDVGQNSWEEVNLITKGGNYGWSVMEGNHCFGQTTCGTAGLVPPVVEYPIGSTGECSVTGGFVYRGAEIPELRGAYVYGDYCSGRVKALRHQNGRATVQGDIARSGFNISSFAQDRDGEVYVLQHAPQGGIYRIRRAA